MVSAPKKWSTEGKVVRTNNVVTDGPYAEIKESIGGLIFVKATDFDDAVEMAKGCPVLQWGGNIEVRMAVSAWA